MVKQLKPKHAVIDDDILMSSLEEDRNWEIQIKREHFAKSSTDTDIEVTQPEDTQPIVFGKVESLRLSYKNILRIDNLYGFDRLHTLRLDNNAIEDIANLSHLVTLEWLDLSFNKISRIKGLEKLVNLKDLSLLNNYIEKIENLDTLVNLECLSLGQNKINNIEDIRYLRQFKALRLVTLSENPVCSDPEFRVFTLAFLPQLEYLDYKLLDQEEVRVAKEQYQDELLAEHEKEALEEANAEAAAEHQAYLEQLRAANLVVLETLFGDMFSKDKDSDRLKTLPGFDEAVEKYREEYKAVVARFVESGLALFQSFEKEITNVDAAYDQLTQKNDAARVEMAKLVKKKKKQVQEIVRKFITQRSNGTETDSSADMVAKIYSVEMAIESTRDGMMTIEMQQSAQLKSLLDIFEDRSLKVRGKRVDNATNFFRTVENLENMFSESMNALANELVEKMGNNELYDLDDDAVTLLSDKETLLTIMQEIHDIHLEVLLQQEDITREGFMKGLQSAVQERASRNREIHRQSTLSISQICNEITADCDKMRRDLDENPNEEHAT